MKDLFLIPIMLAVFAFGYYVMTKVDRFIEEDRCLIADEDWNGQSKVRIAAENPMLLDSIASALESCSAANPHIAFFLSSGGAGRLMEKLLGDQIDIVLLSEDHGEQMGQQYASLHIPYEKSGTPIHMFDLPVVNLDENREIQVVWKKSVKSKDRDRVIFALENEHYRLKCGYADYLE